MKQHFPKVKPSQPSVAFPPDNLPNTRTFVDMQMKTLIAELVNQRKEHQALQLRCQKAAESGVRDKDVEAEVDTAGESSQTGKSLHEIQKAQHAVASLQRDIKEGQATLNSLREEECKLRSKVAALRAEQQEQEDRVHGYMFMNMHTSLRRYFLIRKL